MGPGREMSAGGYESRVAGWKWKVGPGIGGHLQSLLWIPRALWRVLSGPSAVRRVK